MLESYWELNSFPFHQSRDLCWYYESETHTEAMARLFYQIEQLATVGLLTGPQGMGKSLLLNVLQGQIARSQRRLGFVNAWGCDGTEILQRLCRSLRLPVNDSSSRWEMWRRLEQQISANQLCRTPTVLLIDHYDHAHSEAYPTLERLLTLTQYLAEGNQSGQSLLTLIVAIDDSDFLQQDSLLLHFTELEASLTPWGSEESQLWLKEMFQRAGRSNVPFEESAQQELFDLGEGLPQKLKHLCHLCLLAGMDEFLQMIPVELVKNVAEELHFPTHHLQQKVSADNSSAEETPQQKATPKIVTSRVHDRLFS